MSSKITMHTSRNILFDKLDDFITKYYKNQIIRGIILSLLIFVTYFSIIATVEYFAYLPQFYRYIIFYSTIALSSLVLIYFVLVPIFHLFRLGKVMDYNSAALLVSTHFPDLQDKLINTLQLIDETKSSDNALLLASIQQRTESIKPLPFKLAIKFSTNVVYVRYLAVVLTFISLLFFFNPSVITDGTRRLISYDTYYEPAKPFEFKLLNDNLAVEKGSDLKLLVKITGDYVPSICEIVIGNTSFFMKKETHSLFSYQVNNINNTFSFKFTADNYSSKIFDIAILAPPYINGFHLSTECPAYTNHPNVMLENIGDISIPEGSRLHWNFSTSDISQLYIKLEDDSLPMVVNSVNSFSFTKKATRSFKYSIIASNSFFSNRNIISYAISVIPDLYPSIDVTLSSDSINSFITVFNGIIKDDYGFNKLTFNYQVNGSDSVITLPISIANSTLKQYFTYAVDFSFFKTADKIKYYFEIFDNDAVNGSKSTKTNIFLYNVPTIDELKQLDEKTTENVEQNMSKALGLAKELKKEIENVQKKLINQSVSEWEKKQLSQQLEDKHEKLMKLLEQVSQENKQRNSVVNQFSDEFKQELIDKQKEIQDLLDQVIDDELKKMLEDYQKLMQQFEKNKFFQESKEMKYSYDDLEKEIDKNLELLKRYDVEKKVNEAISELKNLKEKQDQLLHETDDKDISKEELTRKQTELNKKSEDISNDYKKALEKNNELDNRMNLNNFDKEFEELSNSMKNSEQQMKEGSKSNAKKSMEKSSEKMEELSQLIEKMMQMNQEEQNSEDETVLRQILDNLITLSFKQEKIIDDIKGVSNNDPMYITISKQQLAISDDFKIIKDSLYELAKRQKDINKPITEEISKISRSLSKAIEGFEARTNYTISTQQQLSMTSLNNLSLLLSEVLQSMQQQANQQQNSSCNSKSCKNPKKGKGSKPSLSDMKKQQESMKQQLQQMLDKMKEGNDAKGGKMMGQQLSKMLSQQEKYQQMINDLMKDGGFSPDAEKKLSEIKQIMEQNKKDLINKSITPQTLQRQNQILTRLLEADNAEKKRETEEERESKSPINPVLSNPAELSKYKNKSNASEDVLEYHNIRLNNYYKLQYDDYLININK